MGKWKELAEPLDDREAPAKMEGDALEPQPVAWWHKKKDQTIFTTKPIPDLIGKYWKPLYARPPKQGWIGLTDEEFKWIVCKNHNPHTQSAKRIRQTIKEIEDTLKEKNYD